VDLRLLVFPEDNHPIDKPASEAEHWVAIADWLATHV
jgi:dipeptidyl aminopeptidase/acylaminoacyl peptidase